MSTGLYVFGQFQLYGSYLWYGGPTLLKLTPSEDEQGIDKQIIGNGALRPTCDISE